MMMMTIRCTAADLDKRPQNKERVNNISLSLHRRSCTRWSSQSAHHLLNTSIREEDEDGGRWRGNDYCKYMTMCLVSFFFLPTLSSARRLSLEEVWWDGCDTSLVISFFLLLLLLLSICSIVVQQVKLWTGQVHTSTNVTRQQRRILCPAFPFSLFHIQCIIIINLLFFVQQRLLLQCCIGYSLCVT